MFVDGARSSTSLLESFEMLILFSILMSSSSIDEISFSALKYEIIYFVEIIPSNKVKELGKMLIEA